MNNITEIEIQVTMRINILDYDRTRYLFYCNLEYLDYDRTNI